MKKQFLELGSIVTIKNHVECKFIIMSRALIVKTDGKLKLYDYCGCLYPEGIAENQITYFNEEDVEEVIYHGYRDSNEDIHQDLLNKRIAEFGDNLTREPRELYWSSIKDSRFNSVDWLFF